MFKSDPPPDMNALKIPRCHGSENGTEMVYIVEARSTYHTPQDLGIMILDNRWRKVPVESSPIGVKNDAFSAEALRFNRYLGFKAATALAHWFLANVKDYCIEARLVKIKLTHSFNTEEAGVGPSISMIDIERETQFIEREP